MKTLEQLNERRQAIHSQIRENRFSTDSKFDLLVGELREIEREEKRIKLVHLVDRVNREQSALREIAAAVYAVEQPGVDITTNSGQFHAVKVKKYPKIQALGEYARATFSEGGVMYRVRLSGKEWTLALNRSGYNEGEKYEFFATFEEFLKHNGVMADVLTVEQVERIIEANNAAIEKMKQAEQEFSKVKEELNLYQLSNVGLFEQRRFSHIYEFAANI